MKELAQAAGRRMVGLVNEDLRPRQIMTPQAFRNAITVGLAVSGSINMLRHLQGVAAEGEIDSSSWGGILAPAGTPKDVVKKLHDGVVQVLKTPQTKERLDALGAEIVASTPEQFGSYIQSETDKWAKVVKVSGAVAE